MNLNPDFSEVNFKVISVIVFYFFSVSCFQFIVSKLVKDPVLAFDLEFQHAITQHWRSKTLNTLAILCSLVVEMVG